MLAHAAHGHIAGFLATIGDLGIGREDERREPLQAGTFDTHGLNIGQIQRDPNDAGALVHSRPVRSNDDVLRAVSANHFCDVLAEPLNDGDDGNDRRDGDDYSERR